MAASTERAGDVPGMELRGAERARLRRLAEIGGRYRFRPDGDSLLALRAFEEGILAVLLSRQDKQLIRVDRDATDLICLPGDRIRIATITAGLTNTGWNALR
jgi:hypothetical protein